MDQGELVLGRCPLCGEASSEVVRRGCHDHLLGGDHRWKLVRCLGCGLVRTEPRPRPEELPRFYASSYYEGALGLAEGSGGRRTVSLSPHVLLSRLLAAPYRIRYGSGAAPAPPHHEAEMLDIGPGRGDELAQHARLGWTVWAIEPGEAAARAAAAAAQIPSERVIVALAEEAQLPERQFRRVVMSHVIEHLSDPAEALRRVRSWMHPEGVLLIRCPNYGSLERRLFGASWAGLDVPRHLQHFTRQTLAALISQCGMRIVRTRPQLEHASVCLSLAWLRADRGEQRQPSQVGRGLEAACMPLISAARSLGAAGAVEVEVRRR